MPAEQERPFIIQDGGCPNCEESTEAIEGMDGPVCISCNEPLREYQVQKRVE